ncbi:MAG: hypothetical protein KAX44_00620, partial [Candidatus Brocadiae bacterium]|nr:hypothetical protein [Candidatus Brocadiia bacterium]
MQFEESAAARGRAGGEAAAARAMAAAEAEGAAYRAAALPDALDAPGRPGMAPRRPVRRRTGRVQEEEAGERLVVVTIKGYVLDFVPPEKGEGQ